MQGKKLPGDLEQIEIQGWDAIMKAESIATRKVTLDCERNAGEIYPVNSIK